MNNYPSNKMNYMLIICLASIALCMIASMVYSRLHHEPADINTFSILSMIVGGFLTILSPNVHGKDAGQSVEPDTTVIPAVVAVDARTPPSGSSGVTKSFPPNPSTFPDSAQ